MRNLRVVMTRQCSTVPWQSCAISLTAVMAVTHAADQRAVDVAQPHAADQRVVDVAQPPAVPADLSALRKVVQQQQDVLQIQNMMSRRSFYHAAGQQAEELEFYANRPDISFGQNQGFRVGMPAIAAAYKDRYAKVRALDLERISKLHPEIKNVPENIGVGMFQVHTITTPIIEVADDGQTAKGMWYTPGAVAGVTDKGTLGADWIWEKYAVDFIKEDGKWKFWHIVVVTDIAVPWGVGAGTTMSDSKQQGAEGVPDNATVVKPLPRTVAKDLYKPLSSTTVPRLFPPLPVPYRTFSETFSYGPDVPAR
jgi:SnoaL-like domain